MPAPYRLRQIQTILHRLSAFVFLTALTLSLQGQNHNLALRSVVTFPDDPIAGVWSYAQDGREYALVAGTRFLHIVDVTVPDAPQKIVKLVLQPDWGREVRTFRNYAYVSSEAGAGLEVFNLAVLPSTVSTAYPRKTVHFAGGTVTRGHTLHIDTTAGTLYLYSNTQMFDLLPDPFNPAYVGSYVKKVHDGYADNDTLYAAHIYDGFVAVVDMHDKANPVVLQTFDTPGRFPHNTWLLPDRRHLIVADEISDGFLTVWDVSDLDNIRETARFRSKAGSGSTPHNAFVIGNHITASWYRDGIIVLDATRPDNLVEVGRYDTDPGQGEGYEGCWGNCPYLPSGNLLVSDKDGGLFIFTPTYARACYLEGRVTDQTTGQPLAGAGIRIRNGQQSGPVKTAADGRYRTGQRQGGPAEVLIYREGYRPRLEQVSLTSGQVTVLDVALVPLTEPGEDLPVLVVAEETGLPLAGIQILFYNPEFQLTVQTDARGWAQVPVVARDSFTVYPAVWGRLPRPDVVLEPGEAAVLRLSRGYYDDFYFDLGWHTEGQAERGMWQRQVPEELSDWGNDLGGALYCTGPAVPYGDERFGLEKGTVRLVSPPIDLSGFQAPYLLFRFTSQIIPVSATQGLRLFWQNSAGEETEIWKSIYGGLSHYWHSTPALHLPAGADGLYRLIFEASNPFNTNIEAPGLAFSVDALEIRDSFPPSTLFPEDLVVWAYPNPTPGLLRVRCQLPPGHRSVSWTLSDAAGRRLAAGRLDTEATELSFPEAEAAGTYFLTFQPANRPLKTIRLVKL